MRHKRILDVAADRPDASLEELAEEVPTATVELVESVLEKYGDPATEGSEPADTPADQDMAERPDTNGSSHAQHAETSAEASPSDGPPDDPSVPDPAELSPKQRETLRAIAEHPDATQRELATELGVADATVSNRVNAIDGFAWDDRQAFVERVFGDEVDDLPADDQAPTDDAGDASELAELETRVAALEDELAANGADDGDTESQPGDRIDALADRLEGLEERVADLDDGSAGPFGTAELTHKVVHACLASDRFTEDEELEIIRHVLE